MKWQYFLVMTVCLAGFYWAQAKAVLTRDTKTIALAALFATVGAIVGQVLAARMK